MVSKLSNLSPFGEEGDASPWEPEVGKFLSLWAEKLS